MLIYSLNLINLYLILVCVLTDYDFCCHEVYEIFSKPQNQIKNGHQPFFMILWKKDFAYAPELSPVLTHWYVIKLDNLTRSLLNGISFKLKLLGYLFTVTIYNSLFIMTVMNVYK